jgi:acyl-CoA oxidase
MSTAADTPTPSPADTTASTSSGASETVAAHEHLDPLASSGVHDRPHLVAALRTHLDGPFSRVRDHCRALDPATFGPPPAPLPMDAHRVRVTAQLGELAAQPYAAYGFPPSQGGEGRYGEAVAAFEMLGHTDLSLFVKAGVQWGLFGGAVSLLGTNRHDHLVPQITSGELQGCFAMTETGHGSDVQSLLTTATYDADTDEIVVHSPEPAARKDYIGNAARDGRLAAVFAQLVVGGESHGVHCVLVPIRGADGSPAPNVTIEDCGPKLGLSGVDNGRLTFDHVRVPRTNLLGRYGDIDETGTYSSPIDNPGRRFFTMLGTLVRGRISVAGGAGAAARSALAVTTTYAAGRRQFAAPGADVETTVLDYRTYQRRLLPRIATAYALQLAQHELVSAMDDVLSGRTTAERDQRLLETRAAGIKVLTSRHATETIQECRELCGGAGYLWANRLAALKADTDIFTTFEGDNTVLLQLVAKSLLTEYRATFGDLDTVGIVRFGARLAAGTVMERSSARGIIQRIVDASPGREEDDTFASRGTQLRLLREREEHMLEGLARRLRRASAPGADAFAAFNACQDHLVDAAMAHVERMVAESFVESVESCADPEAKAVLARVCDLHVLTTIERHKAWYLEHDRLSPARTKALTALVNEICAELRPHATTLVDAFGIPEGLLTTEMSGTA